MDLKTLLDQKVVRYNQPGFIANDPISVPHSFTKKQDIEIMGFVAAVLAWGQRKTIINKCKELAAAMDNSPHDFLIHHTEADLKRFLEFRHRTFNATDALYFIHFLGSYYKKHDSLESAFTQHIKDKERAVEQALTGFHPLFFAHEDAPARTRKHIATPERKSACKRLNMFLRWMVRKDNNGVDFGIWQGIQPAQLICPLDVHVERVGRHFGLIRRPQTDWLTAVELTENLRHFDVSDPVKYDFALFGIGVEKENYAEMV